MVKLAILPLALSAAGLLYVIFLYPCLLGILARRGKPLHPRPILPSVTILLPVRNGGPWLRRKLESILQLDYPRELLEILVISDGSDDDTDEIAAEFASRVQLLRIPRGGKALALNAGLKRATGEILFYTDVRQTLDPASLRHLVSFFANECVGVVSGELVIRDGETQAELHTGLYWKYEKRIRRLHSRIDSAGGATGCIYAMRRSLARAMPANTILDDIYLPAGAFLRGYRIVWTDGAKAFDFPTPLGVEYRRKVRTEAGVYQLLRFYPALLNPRRNRMWLHFYSHRVGRLLLPFFLMGTLLGVALLPWPWSAWLFAGQAAFYATALLDHWIPERMLVKRLTSLIRTFVVLVLAALKAATILFHPDRDFWTVTQIGHNGAATVRER